jgi:hypothetical protein
MNVMFCFVQDTNVFVRTKLVAFITSNIFIHAQYLKRRMLRQQMTLPALLARTSNKHDFLLGICFHGAMLSRITITDVSVMMQPGEEPQGALARFRSQQK